MFGQEGPVAAHTDELDQDALSARLTAQIELNIIDWLALRAGSTRETLGRDSEFAALGIDSVAIVELVAEIERSIGQRLPDSSAFEYPSVGELAAFVSSCVLQGKARDSVPPALAAAPAAFVTPRFAVRS